MLIRNIASVSLARSCDNNHLTGYNEGPSCRYRSLSELIPSYLVAFLRLRFWVRCLHHRRERDIHHTWQERTMTQRREEALETLCESREPCVLLV